MARKKQKNNPSSANDFNQRAAENDNFQASLRGFKPRNEEQEILSKIIKKNMLTFATGEAGTGKTHIAIAHAVEAFENRQINKIILTRPAVTAGEDMGYYPGTPEDKIAPFMKPLFEKLDKILGRDRTEKMLQSGEIEIVPVGLMRGREFENAYIVLDEAQNTTPEQMKMLLTRIGKGTRAIVCGDLTQNDLPPHMKSGLEDGIDKLQGHKNIGYLELLNVERCELVQTIVDAYKTPGQKQQKPPHM